MTNFFTNVKCAEELRKKYMELTKLYHPDRNPNGLETMKAINAQYETMWAKLKDVHANTKDDKDSKPYYTETRATAESFEDFQNILFNLFRLDGLEIELCGRWLWISGDTRTHKDILKKLGCKWSNTKKMWSWHFADEWSAYSRKRQDMSAIRAKYGSMHIDNSTQPALA